jgi:hypothetical protein
MSGSIHSVSERTDGLSFSLEYTHSYTIGHFFSVHLGACTSLRKIRASAEDCKTLDGEEQNFKYVPDGVFLTNAEGSDPTK